MINQVAYNTTYAIDFLKDGEDLQQEKVYQGYQALISPGSFERPDDGSCIHRPALSPFRGRSGNKEGLGFTIVTHCSRPW